MNMKLYCAYIITLIYICLGQASIASEFKNKDSEKYIEALTSSYFDKSIEFEKYQTESYKLQLEYMKNLLHHEKVLMDISEKDFIAQKWQTITIAILVHFMVIVGLFLSYFQFKKEYLIQELRNSKELEKETSNINQPNNEKTSPLQSTFKMGASGLEISSSIIGLIILVVSFLFYGVYVDKVYTIEPISLPVLNFTP